MKTCSKCCTPKDRSEFNRKSDAKDGLYPLCKACVKIKNAKRVAADPEANARQVVEWNRRNADRRREIARGYARRNSKANALRSSEWARANPGKVSAKAAAYVGAKLQATPAWADLSKIASFYEKAAELAKKTGIDYHVDHVVPLRGKVVCGLHCESNLKIITASENRSKSNRYWPDMP